MRDRNRLRNILAAGLLTGLVLATVVAFGWSGARSSAASQGGGQTASEESLQSENERLRQALSVMQEREAAYQTQIDAANQTIEELQSPATTTYRRFDDDDEHEYEDEHEDEEDDDRWWDDD